MTSDIIIIIDVYTYTAMQLVGLCSDLLVRRQACVYNPNHLTSFKAQTVGIL